MHMVRGSGGCSDNSVVISELEKQTGGQHRSFQHYVMAYSGASGGTIGLSELCAARYSLKQALLPEGLATSV